MGLIKLNNYLYVFIKNINITTQYHYHNVESLTHWIYRMCTSLCHFTFLFSST